MERLHQLVVLTGRRAVVYGALAALAWCVVMQVEAWPLSAFRLFSLPRSGTEVAWEISQVDAAQRESPLDLAGLGRGFRQSAHQLPSLARDTARRDAACDAWLSRTDALELRVYRSVRVRFEPGDRPVVTERVLKFRCER